ncbi:MAG: transglutaminase family protein [Pseudomonadota bacterium]
MRLKIHHTTRYSFEEPVVFALQQVRKTPKTAHSQTVLQWRTHVTGGRRELSFEDHHHNVVELLSYDRDTTALEVVSEGEVELGVSDGIVGRHRGPVPLWLYQKSTRLTEAKAGVRSLVRGIETGEVLEALHALSEQIRGSVAYQVGASQPDWSAEDAIAAGAGVCQDHTHIFLACARRMGVPARYVSGYLMLDDRIAQEAMHAWAEGYIEGLGWVGFDVSNGISPDTRYVRVATGLDYHDAAPVSGRRIGGAGEKLEVAIDVTQQ